MEKCECYIHSLKQGETHVLGEATIIKRLGDNDYLAEYNGVKCHAIFNPFAGRYFVDDAWVAVCEECVSVDGEYEMILHPDMLNNEKGKEKS